MPLNEISTKQRRVLIVSEYYLPHWTGVALSVYYLAESLREQGYDLSILTTQFDASLPREENIEGIRIERVPYQFKFSRTHYSLAMVWAFARRIAHYDAVIINSPNSNILFLSLLAKLWGKHTEIYHQGDIVMPRKTGNMLANRSIEALFRWLTRPAMRMAGALSCFTLDYLESSSVTPNASQYFHTFIPPVRLSSDPPEAQFKAEIDSIVKDKKIVGIAGRFVEEKGFDTLLKALPQILDEHPDCLLLFAGQTQINYEPYFAYLEEEIARYSDRIHFLGLLSGGDYAYFYEVLDVFALCSRTECFALTQIEAVQKGVPIVVSDTPGARMLVKTSGFGEVVPMDDPAALAEGICKVLAQPLAYRKYQASAQAYIDEHSQYKLALDRA